MRARPGQATRGWGTSLAAATRTCLSCSLRTSPTLVGLGLAITGAVLATLTDAAIFEAIASYLIGALLAANAVFLAWEMASLLLGETAQPDVERAVLEAVAATGPGWNVTADRPVHLGPDDLLVIVEIEIGSGEDDKGLAEWMLVVEENVRSATTHHTRTLLDVRSGSKRRPTQGLD
jgi:divalent metal cation (Fe/Co/Zn/Cd) transporter